MSNKKEELTKSWKQKMAGALGAALVAATPATELSHTPEPAAVESHTQEPPMGSSPKDFDVPLGEHPLDTFVKPIATLESQMGKYLDHRPMLTGLHAGTVAAGTFAIMPKTLQNIGGMLRNKQSILRSKLGEHYSDPEILELSSKSPDEINATLKSKDNLQRRAARYLALHLMTLHNGDPLRAAFGYRFGHNRKSSDITDKKLQDSGYVKEFKRLYEKK
jgi:hypothetical protein